MKNNEYDLSAPNDNWGSQEVVGEFAYARNLKSLIRELHISERKEAFFTVELIPEPDNPHSPNGIAISVRRNNAVLGYLPESDAESYQQIKRIVASGLTPVCKARIWYYQDFEGEYQFYLKLCLRTPDNLMPLNEPPYEEWALLPFGNSSQVTKEVDHLDILLDYVPPAGIGQLLVSLHLFNAGVKTKYDGVEVRLDGERIGELTKQTSAKFASAIRHFDEQGVITVALATIKGSSLSAEVTLHSAKSHELSEEDLEQESSPLPRLVAYRHDPTEYDVPDAYKGAKRKRTWKESLSILNEPSNSVEATQFVPPTYLDRPTHEEVDPEQSIRPNPTPQYRPAQHEVFYASSAQENTNQPNNEEGLNENKKPSKSQVALWVGVVFSGMCLITALSMFMASPIVGIGYVLIGLGIGLGCGWELNCRNEDKKSIQQWQKELSDFQEWSQYLTDPERRDLSGAVSSYPPEKKPRQWKKLGTIAASLIFVGFALYSAGADQLSTVSP